MTTIATKYPFVGYIETRQGGRQENQDNAGFVDTPIGLLLVVCDGMGGGPGGRTASRMAVDQILTVLEDVAEHTNKADALRFAIEKANELVFAKSAEEEQLRGMGTTVAAMIIGEDAAVVAHVGDTRIYQLRKGRIIYRSKDHSVVAALVEEGRLTEEEARNHPQSNIVTKVLGVRPTVDIDIDELAFQRGDRFVLCTDGIWGTQPQEKLLEALSRPMGIAELALLVAEETDELGKNAGGGHDNLTLAIVDTSFASTPKRNAVKTIQKETIETKSKHHSKKHSSKYLLWVISIIISAIIVAFFCFYMYSVRHSQAEDKALAKGETKTTIHTRDIMVSDSGSMQKQINDTNKNHSDNDKNISDNNVFEHNTNLNKNIENLFDDNNSLKQYERQFVAQQIKKVVKSLDSLKKIRNNSRNKAIKEKSNFVKNVITPEIKKLGEKVQKPKNIQKIMKLLNDKKTVSSSSNGSPTKDGNKHIEIIKNKVKELKEYGNN